jgi:nucleoside-diphosphate-sugar epimerase
VAGNVFNVACGDRITINDLVSALNDILGTRIESVHVEPRKGDVRHSIADISRARDLLGYTPRVTFREGLSQTVDWFKKERAGSTA